MAYKVGLIDKDQAYQKALTDYLNLRASVSIQLFAFTNEQLLEHFVEKEKPELLLAGDEFEHLHGDCQLLVLTKKREYAEKEGYVFRYQSMDAIMKAILEYLHAGEKAVEVSGAFLAVYSPLGRCGKTVFAHRLCRKYERSLYVNWEGFPENESTDPFGSWLLYCMKSRNPECFSYMKEHTLLEIPPPETFFDIRQVGYEDLKWFRETMKKQDLYDGVVFDIGTTVISDFGILQLFDRVYMPTLADAVSGKKQNAFERMYQQVCGGALSIQYVNVEDEMEE